jgi:hypothetical protein
MESAGFRQELSVRLVDFIAHLRAPPQKVCAVCGTGLNLKRKLHIVVQGPVDIEGRGRCGACGLRVVINAFVGLSIVIGALAVAQSQPAQEQPPPLPATNFSAKHSPSMRYSAIAVAMLLPLAVYVSRIRNQSTTARVFSHRTININQLFSRRSLTKAALTAVAFVPLARLSLGTAFADSPAVGIFFAKKQIASVRRLNRTSLTRDECRGKSCDGG